MATPVSTHRTVTATAAKTAILRCFVKKRPVFLWGPPGIGKSELIADIAKDMGALFIDMRMSLMDPTDLAGIPFFNKETQQMNWAPPVYLPTEAEAAKYPAVVLLLDEMNSAAPMVQASAYQLTLSRKVGTYTLPDNVVVIAAGNRDGDKGITYRMPSPLANRLIHLEMKVNHASWETWAVQNHIHKDVVGFIGFSKGDLFDFDPRSSSRAWASPRSWTFVSELLHGNELNDEILTDLVAGAVGEGTAVKFMAHRKIAGKLPAPMDILTGKVKTLDTKEVSAMYSLIIAMCYELQDSLPKDSGSPERIKWHEMVNNFLVYTMANFNVELVVMAARTALTVYTLPFVPKQLPCYDEFEKRFGKFIRGASGK